MTVLGRLLQTALGLGLLAVVTVALVRPLNTWFVFEPVVVWLATAATTLWLLVAARTARHPSGRAPVGAARVRVGVVAGTLLSAAHLVLALIPFGWDARRVFSSATLLARGQPLPPDGLAYFARYPHNTRLLAVEQVAVWLGDLVRLPALSSVLLVQLLCVAVVLWAVGRGAVELGRPRAVLPVQGLATVLLGLSPHVAVPYTDVPAAAAVAVTGLAMARCHRSWSWPWATVGILALAAGVVLKPYVVVLAIALGLVLLLSRRPRAIAALAAGGALLLGAVLGLDQLAQRVTGLTDERLAQVDAPFPPEHFLAMGTWDSREDSPVRRWGAYRQAQVDATAALPAADRAHVLRAQARQQVEDRGLADNLVFFGSKAAWVWGDGTFWAHGEGADSSQESSLPEPWSALTEWSRGAGEHYRLRAAVVHGVWLGLLLVTASGLVRARPDPLLTCWCTALGGLTAYLLLFEARPRYVWALLPLLLLVWVATLRPERRATNTPMP